MLLLIAFSGLQPLRAEIEKGFYSFFDQTRECHEISKILENSEFRLNVHSWENFEVKSGEEKPRKLGSLHDLKILVNNNNPISAAIFIRKTSQFSVGENELNQIIGIFQNIRKQQFMIVKENASGYLVISMQKSIKEDD